MGFVKERLDIHFNKLSDSLENITAIKGMINLKKISLYNTPFYGFLKTKRIYNFERGVEIRAALNEVSLAKQLIDECELKEELFLDLGNCNLYDDSVELSQLTQLNKLESLSLGSGYFDEKNNFVYSENNLDQNYFSQVPKNLNSQLKEIQIRQSGINKISNIEHLKNLQLLDVSFNKIKKIEGISKLINLEELALHGNLISEIGLPNIYPPKLKILSLSNNSISKIKPLTKLKEITQIFVYNNPIEDCPIDVWSANDINSIKAYFSSVENDKQNKENGNEETITDVKLVILGNSNSGKTHLVKFLEDGSYLDKRNSTHGLNVIRWKPYKSNKSRFSKLKNIEISIWDFGGQEYYHDAYKLFLGNESVYIVMWDEETNKNGMGEIIVDASGQKMKTELFDNKYWLDTLGSFITDKNNTPILLVQNKVDEERNKKRISQETHDEYGINESFHISIKNGVNHKNSLCSRDLEQFSDYLEDTIFRVANLSNEARHTSDFRKVREELMNISDKSSPFNKYEDKLLITIEEFKEVCEEIGCNIEDKGFQFFPQWLSNSGNIVYIDKTQKLRDYIFINPKKISSEIYKVLNEKAKKDNGNIEKNTNSNNELKKSKSLDSNNRDIIFEVMKNLSLIYDHPLKPDTHYLAPQYLPNEHIIEDFFDLLSSKLSNENFWIKVPMFYYKRLIHYLMITFLTREEYKVKHFWKNGIVVAKDTQTIIIKGLYNSAKDNTSSDPIIQIVVRDSNKNTLKEISQLIYNYSRKSDIDNENFDANKNKDFKQDDIFLSNLSISVNGIEDHHFITIKQIKNILDNKIETELYKISKFKNILPESLATSLIPDTHKVFISYSHKNANVLERLKVHLSPLKRTGLIEEWTDQEIKAGDKWDEKIRENLLKSDVIILLLSADFIASDYIWNYELKEAFSDPSKLIIPIYLESFDINSLPLNIAEIELIPKDENEKLKPLNLWENQAAALTKVVERIRESINVINLK